MYDLLLRNGRIYDGSGMPSYIADLAVHEGRIVAIGRINEVAAQVIDVDGLAVAPGIIDFHTPQWSLQNRPMMVTSKPAKGERPRQGCFNLLPPGQASPFWFSNYVDRI